MENRNSIQSPLRCREVHGAAAAPKQACTTHGHAVYITKRIPIVETIPPLRDNVTKARALVGRNIKTPQVGGTTVDAQIVDTGILDSNLQTCSTSQLVRFCLQGCHRFKLEVYKKRMRFSGHTHVANMFDVKHVRNVKVTLGHHRPLHPKTSGVSGPSY